jgi:S-adenosylmethionine:tRNA ribosyltransferase-isomerase
LSFAWWDYELPPHLIAQEPAQPRDASRLLHLNRADRSLHHHVFRDLPDLLVPGDLLVLNDTRVVPARLIGRRERTGGRWEGLFLHATVDGLWEMLTQTRGRLVEGETVLAEPGPLRLMLVSRTPEGHWLARPEARGSPVELLERHGHVPLPWYVRRGLEKTGDRERYQTVYATRAGAVAAPTAGLHFTPELFERLEQRGIGRAFVTLHVGLGTFQPVKEADPTQHQMHREWGELASSTVAALAACKARGGRVVAVGTTSVRVLETAARASTGAGPVSPWSGETDLYVFPPFAFRVVDALITNFHLPRSTLLLLVAAFAGVDLLQTAYRTAIEQGYRFYSYGDAMLIT